MFQPLVTVLGKAVRTAARLRGGGSALPGLFVEKISPDFISRTLADLPLGTVVISGTNGKTTTTKMVVELLESQGLKVFTNRTGSNFTRGVAAALLGEVSFSGKLDADIAVLELDEAHAVKFVSQIKPRFCLLLNVMRDQLDRFGEIDTTAELLTKIAQATTESVVLNREDRRVAKIKDSLDNQKVSYFGLSDDLLVTFPTDDELHGGKRALTERPAASVTLEKIEPHQATFKLGSEQFSTSLKLAGIYNIFNAAAALALVAAIVGGKLDRIKLIKALAEVKPAFGRGEVITIGGQPLELVLVKNPSGFRLGLESFSPTGYATMIAINDNYADGRDMSWLWDVDFSSLIISGVAEVSGIRAYDMALRLDYDNVKVEAVQPELDAALRDFIDRHSGGPKRIYCTYTAMLELRKDLSKITEVEAIS